MKALLALLFTVATAVYANDTDMLLARAWPYAPYAHLTEVGSGVAVVFSPDLSVPGNCHFYRALGFACFEDADWNGVLAGIRNYNFRYPEHAIRTVVLETHGTNGNGLKLQRGHDPDDDRSYISIGALQERLEDDGVRYIIISACNSGRLLRPSIYKTLDPFNGDKLFLPATCGIVGASSGWNPKQSKVTVVTPASSHIEMTIIGSVKELAPSTRRVILASAKALGEPVPNEFAVSDLMMQMLTQNPRLKLRVGGGVDELSREKTDESVSEALFVSFVRQLNTLARREPQNTIASRATR